MRALLQRVSQASVVIDGQTVSSIGQGLLVLLGVDADDGQEDLKWLAAKVAAIRIFDDAEGVMNLSIDQVGGELLVVSQFTLLASTKKGNRPSYIRAAREDKAVPMYEHFVKEVGVLSGRPVATGRFGADMQIALVNDGPVTIWIDSHERK